MPKLARIAFIVAFIMAGLTAISALIGQIVLLPTALIPLMAGVGIVRRRAWSAYGLALYLFAQLLIVPVAVLRSNGRADKLPEIAVAAVLTAALIPLFLFAGRSLAAAGSARGRAWPWIAVSALTLFPLFFIEPFVIPTGAMEETMLIGDHILVQRYPKPSPQRDGLLVFHYPIDRSQTFVKRVIGIPGDRIRISEKIVYRNGAALKEPYVVHKLSFPDSYRDNLPGPEPNIPLPAAAGEMLTNHVVNGEIIVPEGKYFVLGDNRDNSLDSRYWGLVSTGDLIGKPLLIYDSADQPTDEQGKPTGLRRVRWNRIFKLL